MLLTIGSTPTDPGSDLPVGEHMIGTSQQQIEAGSPVEVWSPVSGEWSHGFRIERVEGGAVFLRRLSDGQLLPVGLPLDRIRASVPVTSVGDDTT
jgi:hypothetical protein